MAKFNICNYVECFDGNIIGTCERPCVGQELFCSTQNASPPTSLGTVTHIIQNPLIDYDLCIYTSTGKTYYLSELRN